MKKIVPWIGFIVLAAFIVFIFMMKDKMNSFSSSLIKQTANNEIKKASSHQIDSLYNYSQNQESFELTFLEFGAVGCSACKKMELVMKEIEAKYTQKVKVVFYNVLKPESQDLMKYYGIASIPTQILLDKEGKEYFRHSGYIASPDLEKEFPF